MSWAGVFQIIMGQAVFLQVVLALDILFSILVFKGPCYYPQNYRALIPQAFNSQYKEARRLSQTEAGKVLYLRATHEVGELGGDELEPIFLDVKITHSIDVLLGGAEHKDGRLAYLYIEGFRYYTHWVVSEWCPHHGSRQSVLYESPKIEGWREHLATLKDDIGDDEILNEYKKIIALDDGDKAYISRVFQNAIYAQSPYYIGKSGQ